MHIAAFKNILKKHYQVLLHLKKLEEKSIAFKDVVKIGRTHLMDATPLTLGQEFSDMYLN